MNIRRLVPADSSALIALRREALDFEPLAFAASPADDIALIAESVHQFLSQPESQAVFGSFESGRLIGMIGLVREAKAKRRHWATIWGMYVQPQARRRGVGRSLLNAAIAQGRTWAVDQLHLGVSEAASGAKKLYETVGFQDWGREPQALQWAGQYFDEYHMILEINHRDRRRPNNALQATREDARA